MLDAPKIPFAARCQSALGSELAAVEIHTLQVNIGLKCNLACRHCHLESSPSRHEQMDWATMEQVLDLAERLRVTTLDLTGGAPELNPHFRPLVARARGEGYQVLVRTNLSIMEEEGYRDLPEFHRDHRVHLVASLPCYLEENVDRQRGPGTYVADVAALQRLNSVGYGIRKELELDLVYNPAGPALPPPAKTLEEAYREELDRRFGIRFTRLLTLGNLPVGRFRDKLEREGQLESFQSLLSDAFNPATLDGLMCRHHLHVGWDGSLADCDFNHALKLGLAQGLPHHVGEADPDGLRRRAIHIGDHCFGCTAGQGSSCGGALV